MRPISRQCSKTFRSINLGLCLLLMGFLFQWEFQQLCAWSNMIREYAQSSNLTTAVADTFSGEKPCSMCVQLTKTQTGSEQKHSFQIPESAFSYFLSTTEPLLEAVQPKLPPVKYWCREKLFSSWKLNPPVPPPRKISC